MITAAPYPNFQTHYMDLCFYIIQDEEYTQLISIIIGDASAAVIIYSNF